MNTVKFAVAGCGFIGKLHARVIQSIGGGLCDGGSRHQQRGG